MSEHIAAVPEAGASADGPSPVASRRWAALIVLLGVQFLLVLDASVVNIALPTIQTDLGFTRDSLTWVVDGYVLAAGSLLLFGGRLGDLVGRRRLFLAGVLVFGAASLLSGAAQSPPQLLVGRVAQGIGEALAAPAALGLIALLFTDTRERAKAVGAFGGASGIAGTAGPVLSGLLVEYASWRWIFLLNLPVVLLVVTVLPRLVKPDAATRRSTTSDLPGAALSVAALGLITFGFIRAAVLDWSSPEVLVTLTGGAILLVAFVGRERLAADPLLPLRFLRDRTRAVANVLTFVFNSVFLAQFLIVTLYLQDVQHFSPVRNGLAFLPFGVAVGMAIGLATALLPRVGARPLIVVGLALTGAGCLLFARISPGGAFLGEVLPASVVVALGAGLILPTLTAAAVSGVSEGDAGLAGGIQQAVQQVGSALGLAVLITIAARHTAANAAVGVGPAAALTDGYARAFVVAAFVLFAGTVLAVFVVRSEAGRGQQDPVPADQP